MTGLILLQIYPSEYGLEKMKEENMSGPLELRESPQPQDSDSDDDGNTILLRKSFYFSIIIQLKFCCWVPTYYRGVGF